MTEDDEESFREFALAALPQLRRVAVAQVRDGHRADDRVQMTLEKLYVTGDASTVRPETPSPMRAGSSSTRSSATAAASAGTARGPSRTRARARGARTPPGRSTCAPTWERRSMRCHPVSG